jgi:hypothetical protein
MRYRRVIGVLAASLALGALSPAAAGADPDTLMLTAFVVDQQCQGGDFVNVTLSANVESSSEVLGYKWDWTNNGRFDTRVLAMPTASHRYLDEINVTARIGAKNTEGDTAFDTVSFATLRCEG